MKTDAPSAVKAGSPAPPPAKEAGAPAADWHEWPLGPLVVGPRDEAGNQTIPVKARPRDNAEAAEATSSQSAPKPKAMRTLEPTAAGLAEMAGVMEKITDNMKETAECNMRQVAHFTKSQRMKKMLFADSMTIDGNEVMIAAHPATQLRLDTANFAAWTKTALEGLEAIRAEANEIGSSKCHEDCMSSQPG